MAPPVSPAAVPVTAPMATHRAVSAPAGQVMPLYTAREDAANRLMEHFSKNGAGKSPEDRD
jgi:hypothetical protein